MPFTFFIPKEHRAATGFRKQITVPDKYHDAASKRMSDQFGFSLDTVEGWSASPTAQGTPINIALQSLRSAAGATATRDASSAQAAFDAQALADEERDYNPNVRVHRYNPNVTGMSFEESARSNLEEMQADTNWTTGRTNWTPAAPLSDEDLMAMDTDYYGGSPAREVGGTVRSPSTTGDWQGSGGTEGVGAPKSMPDFGLAGDGTLDFEGIINLFGEDSALGKHVFTDGKGIEVINPLLAQLIDLSDMQAGRVSVADIEEAHDNAAKEIAKFNRDAAVATAEAQGLSDQAVARIMSDADKYSAGMQRQASEGIATERRKSDEYIARQQLAGTRATAGGVALAAQHQRDAARDAAASQAGATTAAAESARLGQEASATSQADAITAAAYSTRLGQEAAARSAAGGVTGAAESARLGQEAAAASQAGAASPFGFLQQGGTQADVASVYDQLNEVGLAQAAAAQLAAQDNPYGYAAAQVNPNTGVREFRPSELAQIGANTPAAFAARGQEAAARAGATGFGALLSGDAAQQANANAILRAQTANNPYAAQQLGQDAARIDQILRGGLSPEQRIAEINASQAGQNFANQLNFMSNPSAVGFATEQGLLNDINNSPEGNLPGSLFGFNSPSAAGAGGGQTTNTGNFNMNTLRNASDEQIGFLQGAAAAGGTSPSEFQAGAESFTPQGY